MVTVVLIRTDGLTTTFQTDTREEAGREIIKSYNDNVFDVEQYDSPRYAKCFISERNELEEINLTDFMRLWKIVKPR